MNIVCPAVSCPGDQNAKQNPEMEQPTAQTIQPEALRQESDREFYTGAKGPGVSFKFLNRDNYLDAS